MNDQMNFISKVAVAACIWCMLAAAAMFAAPDFAFAETTASASTLAAGAAGTSEQDAQAAKDAKAAAAKAAAEAEAKRIADMAVVKDGLYNIYSVEDSDYSLSVKDESVKAKARVAPALQDLTNWSQKWLVVQDKKTGYYTIRNLRSRYLLTVSGKVKSGAFVKQLKKSTSAKQQWQLVKTAKSLQFRSAANPKYSLAIVWKKGSCSFALRKTKSLDTQRFRLEKVTPIEDEHSYFVRSAANTKTSLAVKGASKSAKAKLVLAKRATTKTQKFRFKETGSSYNLQNVRSCLYVGASKSALRQSSGTKGKAKKWKVALDLETGTFTIKSVQTGKFVDARSGKLALRAKAKTAAKAKAQRFVLVPTYGFTVFIDAGHGKNSSGWGVYDPGAPGSGRNEADLTKDLARRIENDLEGSDVRVFNGSDYSVPYWQRNGKARSLGCDVVLSVHFDAGGGSTTSTMVGTRGAYGSNTFNSIIHRKLVSSIGLPDGGTMRRSDITIVNGSVPTVLMEVCFIDNASSLNRYLNRRSSVSYALAEGILTAAETPILQ